MACLPLSAHPSVHTRSLEEASELYARLITPVSIERVRCGNPFEWRANTVCVGSITLSASWHQSGLQASTEAMGDVFAVSFPVGEAGAEAVHFGVSVPLVCNRSGLVASPEGPVRFRMQPGYQGLQVIVRRPVVEAALAALAGAPARSPLRFTPQLSVVSSGGGALLRLTRFLVEEVDRAPALLTSPIVAGQLADAVVYHMLCHQPHSHSASLRSQVSSGEPRYVRQVAEYFDAHAGEPVNMAHLATLTGVSVRSIQAAFRRYRGCSPTEFLKERRLELARARLLASPASTVSLLALECGFEHLGRFSAQYRARFGERPAETLRRARRAAS